MSKHKHLTMEDRQRIMQKLNVECSFRKIAKDLGKSPTTISQEVKKNRTVQSEELPRKTALRKTVLQENELRVL